MKACYGTTKYCNAFLKGLPCNNVECLYLHDVGEAPVASGNHCQSRDSQMAEKLHKSLLYNRQCSLGRCQNAGLMP